MVAGVRARYLLDVDIVDLHALKGVREAQIDRPLEVLSATVPARLLAEPFASHGGKVHLGMWIVLSRGLIKPHQRLLEVR